VIARFRSGRHATWPELPLPSTGVTRFHRYYEPLRYPTAPGLFLAGVRSIIPDHASGLPVLHTHSLCTCRRHCPGAADGSIHRSASPSLSLRCQPSPKTTIGSACTSSFSRIARRSLALRPAHSHDHQQCDCYPKASAISLPPCVLRLLPAGAVAGWGFHPLENAAFSRRTPFRSLLIVSNCGGRVDDSGPRNNPSQRASRAAPPSRRMPRPRLLNNGSLEHAGCAAVRVGFQRCLLLQSSALHKCVGHQKRRCLVVDRPVGHQHRAGAGEEEGSRQGRAEQPAVVGMRCW
jgi:hypothetical protein